jgi:hypothetical protein
VSASRRPSRRARLSLCAGAACVGAAIGGCREPATTPRGPGLKVALTPRTLTIPQGASGAVTLVVLRPRGFEVPVSVRVPRLPEGVIAAPATWTMDAGTSKVSLGFVAEPWAAPGRYGVAIRLKAPGMEEQVETLDLIVSEPDTFRIAVDRPALQLAPGSAATLIVRTHRTSGFARSLELAVLGLPAGAVAEVAHSAAFDDTRYVTIRAEAWMQPSEHVLTVIGTAPGLPPHGVAVVLRIGTA